MPRPLRRSRPMTSLACGALALLFAWLSYSAVLSKSATVDEPLHTAAALASRFLGDHRIDPENPPLWKYFAALPLRRAALPADQHDPFFRDATRPGAASTWSTRLLFQTPGNDGAAVINTARGMMLLLGVAALLLTAGWAYRIGGGAAAIIAATLFALDPTFLAHSALVKNDVAIALLLIALVIALWQAGRRVTFARALAIALICAAAINVKFTGLLFPVIALAALTVRALSPEPWICLRRELATPRTKLLIPAGLMPLIAIVCIAAIWATYGFRYAPAPDPARSLDIPALAAELTSQTDTPARPPLAARAIVWIDRHRLLPQAYSAGFLGLQRAFTTQQNYLLGRIDPGGWWYYFPLAILFKTPLATLAAGGISVALLVSRKLRLDSDHRWALLCCGLAMGIFLLSAMAQPINHGVRHMLPIFPLAFLVIAVVLARAIVLRKKPATIVAAILAAALALETLAAYPNYIAFFNAPSSPHRLHLLADSNLDWGQDLPLLADWQQRHPHEKLHLAYFGTADPAFYGIEYNNLPAGFFLGPPPRPVTSGGVIALSATRLQGLYMTPDLRQTYARFRTQIPREVLGGTIYLFDYSPAFLRARP